jgi:hypothetical protein
MGNGGSGSNDGPLQPLGGMFVSTANILNGTSNVLLIGEKYLTWPQALAGSDCDDDQGWTDGWDNDMIGFSNVAPGVPIPDGPGYDCGNIWGSKHPAGIQAVFCDGSVRNIYWSVTPSNFTAVCSMNNGAVVNWENGF